MKKHNRTLRGMFDRLELLQLEIAPHAPQKIGKIQLMTSTSLHLPPSRQPYFQICKATEQTTIEKKKSHKIQDNNFIRCKKGTNETKTLQLEKKIPTIKFEISSTNVEIRAIRKLSQFI